jgi:hypothetical protein
LIEIGVVMARGLRQDAEAAGEAAPATAADEIALAFSRVSRAVRLTMALSARQRQAQGERAAATAAAERRADEVRALGNEGVRRWARRAGEAPAG